MLFLQRKLNLFLRPPKLLNHSAAHRPVNLLRPDRMHYSATTKRPIHLIPSAASAFISLWCAGENVMMDRLRKIEHQTSKTFEENPQI
jgi:hypothetical protein